MTPWLVWGGALAATLVLAAWCTPRAWWRRPNLRALAVVAGGTLGFGLLFSTLLPAAPVPVAVAAAGPAAGREAGRLSHRQFPRQRMVQRTWSAIQRRMKSATSRLFLSCIIMCELPLRPTSGSRTRDALPPSARLIRSTTALRAS